jgi:thiamine biosynthesis lipoprotein
MERLIPFFDRHDPASMVSHLNDTGVIDSPEPELADLVLCALRYSQACGGHFDPSVAPLVDVIRRKASAGEKPGPGDPDVRRAMRLADAWAIEATPRRIALARPGMALTLDGIAKGRIVDRMSRTMSQAGAHDHLVNAGGDIRTSGRRGPGSPWKIAVRDPRRSDMSSAPLAFSQPCVATSGSYVVYYDREKIFHHLVDPVSGSCPARPVSVTVAGDSVMAADALSTAVFVMDPPDGLALVESMPGCECLVLGRDGSRAATRGFPRLRS